MRKRERELILGHATLLETPKLRMMRNGDRFASAKAEVSSLAGEALIERLRASGATFATLSSCDAGDRLVIDAQRIQTGLDVFRIEKL